ncbi:MAG: transporter, ATP-binding protein [Microvirga sp.]|jgi:branched-chain amino acid transport system ATP-binding protein|nr:transporter, ATP-binding protein [Microvirga sp.]
MLKLDSVQVSYGAIQAVRGVSLEVPEGEVVTIIGANGAGKSTLLKSIVGLEAVTSGRVLLDGRDITSVPPHIRTGLGIALSPEGRGIFPDQTVRDNLLLGAYVKKDNTARTDEKVERSFGLFPRLRERQEQVAGTLSGGEQQMLAIARALMSEPKLLLLDEPSLGLAPLIIKDIFRTISTLREMGLTILLVEQMANQALGVADHAYVLETGQITHQGKGSDLLKDPKVRAAYLGVAH